MSVSMDYSQLEKMKQFLNFVEILSQPNKLEELRAASEELAVRQGIVATIEEAETYKRQVQREIDQKLADIEAQANLLVDKAAEIDRKRQALELEFKDKIAGVEVLKSTLNRSTVDLEEREKKLEAFRVRLEQREAAQQAREADLAAKEQEYQQRVERLRAAVV